jgi:hypothetical protein
MRSGYAAFTTHFRLQWDGPTAIFMNSRKTARHGAIQDNDEFGEFSIIDEGRTTLNKALKLEGYSLVYVYDVGDDWRHKVVLEKILPVEGATNHPVCLGGDRRCPPEDVGGAYGYSDFLDGCHLRPGSQRLRAVHPLGPVVTSKPKSSA